MDKKNILYMSAILPARSETFVYREIFALRSLGVTVHTASVHAPDPSVRTPELISLSLSTIPIYGAGVVKMIVDACTEIFMHPVMAVTVLVCSLKDCIFARDIHGAGRVKILAQALASLSLSRRVRPLNIGHIHAHMAHVPTTIAMYAAKQLGIGFSFTGHANDLFPNRSLLQEKINRAVFVACISMWHRQFYISVFPKAVDQLPIIHCGVDTEKETYMPVKPGDRLRILSVGRFVRKKGFDILIEAVDRIARKGVAEIDLTIAGSGPEDTSLRTLAARLSPSVNVTMPGSVDNETVMNLMTCCDIFVLPMRVSQGDRDGIPVVLMEAMARGRCVVCGDFESIRELVEHGVTGFLIPLEDVAALERTIEELSNDPQKIINVGKTARKHIVHEFDVTKNAQRLVQVMRNVGIGL